MEHAFSGRRLQVGHLQHGTSSQTFKARVAVGSWANMALLPDELAMKIINEATQKNSKKKSSDKVLSVEDSSDDE